MKIVVDTNVLISGVFFGGFPRKILSAIVRSKLTACATAEILDEYEEITQEMIERKQGHINTGLLAPLIRAMEIIEPIFYDKFLVTHKASILEIKIQGAFLLPKIPL